jgi:hypothetical protein
MSVIRLNNRDGTTDIFPYGPENWTFSPKYDIVALQIPVDNDKLGVLVDLVGSSIIPDDVAGKRLAIGVGDNIFMLGRFVDHDGVIVNQAAARFGNISVMPASVVQANGVRADSFCLDMHSRTGFSGSPVFVYRSIGDDLDYTAATGQVSDRSSLKFLGIHWGQFPEYWDLINDKPGAIASLSQRIRRFFAGPTPSANRLSLDAGFVKGVSGMTLVLPAWNIIEVLNLPKLRDQRTREEQLTIQYAREHGMPPIAEHPKISIDWEKNLREQA